MGGSKKGSNGKKRFVAKRPKKAPKAEKEAKNKKDSKVPKQVSKKKEPKRNDPVSKNLLETLSKGSKMMEESNRRLAFALLHYEEKIQALEGQIEVLKKKTSKKRVDALKSTNETLEKKSRALEKNLETKEQVVHHLRNKLDILRTELHDARAVIKELQKESRTRNNAFRQLKQALALRKKEASLSKDVNKKLQEKEFDYEANVHRVESLLKSQMERIQGYEHIVTALTKQLGEFKTREKLLSKKVLLLQEKLVSVEKDVHRKEHEIASVKIDLSNEKKKSAKAVQERNRFGKKVQELQKEAEDLKIEYNLAQEEMNSKSVALSKLQEALHIRRKEAKQVLQLNKQLAQRDARFTEDYQSMRELLNLKNLQLKQQNEAIKMLQQDTEKQRKVVRMNRRAFKEVSEKFKVQEEKLLSVKRSLLESRKELTEKEKEVLEHRSDTENFKAKIKELFGVTQELEDEKMHFKEYLSKLHYVLQEKEKSFAEKQEEYQSSIANLKQYFDDRMEDLLRKDTEQIVSLKATILDLKAKLVKREKQLQEKERLEKLFLQDLTKRFQGLLEGGSPLLDELAKLEKMPHTRPHIQAETDRLLQPPMYAQVYGVAPPQQPMGQGPLQRQKVHQKKPKVKEEEKKVVARQTPPPVVEPVQKWKSAKELAAELNLHEGEILDEEVLYGGDRDDTQPNYDFERPDEEAFYARGSLIQKERDDKEAFTELAERKHQTQHVEIASSYRKGDDLTPMIDLGLQQGDNIEQIKDSLIQTGYDPKEVEESILKFKRGKIGLN